MIYIGESRTEYFQKHNLPRCRELSSTPVPAVKRRGVDCDTNALTFIVVAVDRICMRARFCNRISKNTAKDRLTRLRTLDCSLTNLHRSSFRTNLFYKNRSLLPILTNIDTLLLYKNWTWNSRDSTVDGWNVNLREIVKSNCYTVLQLILEKFFSLLYFSTKPYSTKIVSIFKLCYLLTLNKLQICYILWTNTDSSKNSFPNNTMENWKFDRVRDNFTLISIPYFQNGITIGGKKQFLIIGIGHEIAVRGVGGRGSIREITAVQTLRYGFYVRKLRTQLKPLLSAGSQLLQRENFSSFG